MPDRCAVVPPLQLGHAIGCLVCRGWFTVHSLHRILDLGDNDAVDPPEGTADGQRMGRPLDAIWLLHGSVPLKPSAPDFPIH